MVLECIAISLIPDQATGNLKTMNPLAYVDISRPSHPNLRGAFLDDETGDINEAIIGVRLEPSQDLGSTTKSSSPSNLYTPAAPYETHFQIHCAAFQSRDKDKMNFRCGEIAPNSEG
ncbi:hypothetical protein Agabi119p4_6137 [Agaricus bisporus var. burnettii]|uniref:Uncharacterized protein n=1 Tax=Agaricus bisporus var. burnettii TaxID=192524 RepID=A0A8H7KGB6_AGABI|nr:hypothetical protein Agabi119p4_6137 [Agaricus bisporus var. burnettii]